MAWLSSYSSLSQLKLNSCEMTPAFIRHLRELAEEGVSASCWAPENSLSLCFHFLYLTDQATIAHLADCEINGTTSLQNVLFKCLGSQRLTM